MTAIDPYKILTDSNGNSYPWYVLPFDKKGRVKAPHVRQHIVNAISHGDYSDIFLFSHGWNNDWKTATDRYQHFINGFSEQRAQHDLALPDDFKPLLIGIIWPSTWLVLPNEKAPKLAAGGTSTEFSQIDQIADAEDSALSDLADALDDQYVERFYQLAGQESLNKADALELAKLVNPMFVPVDESGQDSVGEPEDLLESWLQGQALSKSWTDQSSDDGLSDDVGVADAVSTGPIQSANILSKIFFPRHLIRMGSVWRMKDRAGKVGYHGVGPLLTDILTASQSSKVHLIGHSFGAKVVLSASSHQLPRQIHSMLLLQPAVSARCFSANADGNGTVGGYRNVLDKVSLPIVTTFSKHDAALTKMFHLAVRRKSDIGETRIAGAPSRFAALGGFGPAQASELEIIAIKKPNEAYTELARDNIRLLALHSDDAIAGHGDISNPATWWVLYEQVRTNGS